MKKTRLAWLAAAAATALALTGCSGGGSGEGGGSGTSGDPVVIGVSAPLTGNQAEYGKNWQEGAKIALDEINAEGGVHGRPLEVDFQDSAGEAAQATTIAQRFVSEPSVIAVMGDLSSTVSAAASPIYQRGGLMQVGITNSHPDFTSTGDFIFSPVISQDEEASQVEKKAAEYGDRIALVHLNNDWGIAAADIVKETAEENGQEIVYEAAVEESSTDFKPQLLQLRDAKPDVIIFYTYYATTALLSQQAQQVGIEDVPTIAASSNYSGDLLEVGGEAAEGLIIPSPFLTESEDPEVNAFIDAFTEEYGYAPNAFAAYAYDGVKQIAWAANEAEEVDRTQVRDALRDSEGFPSIIYGEGVYDENRRVKNPVFHWIVVRDGEFVTLED